MRERLGAEFIRFGFAFIEAVAQPVKDFLMVVRIEDTNGRVRFAIKRLAIHATLVSESGDVTTAATEDGMCTGDLSEKG